MVEFGGHVLCHLASSLSNVIRQEDRWTKISVQTTFWHLAVSNYLLVLNVRFGFGNTKTIL